MKNIKYYQGNGLMWSTDRTPGRISDDIFDFTDSTIIFEFVGEVKFKDVTTIYRRNWLVETARGLTFIGGVAYFSIDSFNRLINHDYPVVLPETLAISGGLVAVSFVLMPFKYRKIHTGKNWSMRVIDKNEYDR